MLAQCPGTKKTFLMQSFFKNTFMKAKKSLNIQNNNYLYDIFNENNVFIHKCHISKNFFHQKSIFGPWTLCSHAFLCYFQSKNVNFYIFLIQEPGFGRLDFVTRKNIFFKKIPKMVSRRDYNHLQYHIKVYIC